MWRKGEAEGIKNIFYGKKIFDSQLRRAANIEKENYITESDFAGTEEYLNQMYGLLFTEQKRPKRLFCYVL